MKNSSRTLKWLRVVICICIAIVVIELIYIGIKAYTNNKNLVYVDALNTLKKDDNDYIVAGNSDFKNSKFNSYQKDYTKAKFAKYDKDFNIKFESSYTKGYQSYFSDVASYKDGYIAVGGAQYSQEQVDDNATDGLIVLYDKNGKQKKTKSLQIAGDTTFTKVLVCDDGFIVIGQSILQNMVIGSDPKGGALIIKYDFDLNEKWRANYGGSKSAIFNDAIIVDNDIYLVGKDATRYGMIAKYTLDGEQVYVKSYEYTDTVGFSSIVKDGDYLFVGGSKTINADADDEDIVTEALIVKYDLDGNVVNDVSFGVNNAARYNKIIIDGDSIVAIGHTYKKDDKESTDTYNVLRYSGIIAKYDFDLKEIKTKVEKGSRDNYFSDIILTDDGYLIGGQTSSKELGGNNKDFRTYFLKYNKSFKKEWFK